MTGYRRNRRVYKLTFEDYPGLEVMARSVPVDDLLGILELADKMTGNPSEKQVRDLFGRFAGAIEEWNYEDEDGKPLPPTLGTLLADDFDFALKLTLAWIQAVSAVKVPSIATPAAATAGSRDPVESSIPVSPATGM